LKKSKQQECLSADQKGLKTKGGKEGPHEVPKTYKTTQKYYTLNMDAGGGMLH